ncbi:unnamed protein product [Phytophthora fragariaefolia]|uniref:RNA-directed DNA polymerase n=1 Tax=Phytophthora fragariaefolia TaxID=1490495 RepID=A0A9W6Y501_9STRA|nr:unnamed protein product [Phytophthora fragariaefolia]
MSEIDQVSYYCDGLKRATEAYVKLQNTMTLSEAMDQAVKYEMSHFSGDHKVNREKPEREPRFRGPPRPTSGSKKKPFTNRSYKPGHYSPTAQSKEGPVCYYCKKPGHSKRDLYVSRAFVKEYGLKTQVYTERTIRVKLGDNKIGEAILELVTIEIRLKNVPNYQYVAVVFDIPEEFDCVLGMPYFVDVQSAIDWKRRCIKSDVQVGASTMETSTPLGKAAVPETRLEDEVEIVERPTEDGRKPSMRERKNAKAEAMFTLGVVDSDGVETKYISRKKLRKFLRLSGKDAPEHDFMVVLTNDTIKRIEQDLKRNDEPDNVGSEKAKRFLHTDWESFNNNPAYPVIIDYKDNVFKPELPEGLPMERDIEHRIDVKDPNIAMYRQQWRLSPEQKAEIDKWVREMIAKGLIRPSISPHAAPTFCVRKPVGWRIVHDYRYLNSNTIRQSVPMTRKEDVFGSMAGAYYFSCMDLMSAYYQVRMNLDHTKYTAFQAPSGLYEYLVLPMGISNAPATMHRLTSSLFKGLTHTRSFYDDIYVFTKSKDIDEHLRALRDVLEILKKNKLYVKLSKCVFCAEEIPCLGDFIGRNGVRIDPDKVQTIRDWPVPRTQEQLHSFLGLTGYVQRFCEQHAELTASLFTLLKKKNQRNSKITLNTVQLKNFKELKQRLADTPVLHLPDFTQQMHLRTDASQFAVGGVLFQVEDGVERPIAYTSRKMKSAELKYPTRQQELLAIVNALAAFRIYYFDRPPMVETDHKSLEGIFQQKMANRRLARWYAILAEYQPVFAYLPGAKNGIADALSRRPDLEPETTTFHDLLVPSFNATSYQLRVMAIKPTSDLIKSIIAGYAKDKVIREIRRAIKKRSEPLRPRGASEKQYKPFFEERNLVWYQGATDEKPRIVVPNVVRLKHRIIGEVHESNYGGHPVLAKHCRRNKPRLAKRLGLMEPLQIPDERWRSISMDYITDLPDTKCGHNSIWVVVDRLTKRTHFIATTKKVSAQEVATLFVDNLWRLHGMPQYIVSDRDTKFISGFWNQVFQSVGTKLKMTVAYRAQGDGQTERTNRTLEEYLRCFVSPRQDDWDVHLANAEFAINAAVNSSIKMSPFEADIGYVSHNPLAAVAESSRRGLRNSQRQGVKFTEHQAAILRQCQDALEEAHARMADIYDHGRQEQEFEVGSQVYLSTNNLDTAHTGFPNSRKLGPKWIGPYSVTRRVHKHAYELNLPPGLKLHPVFNTGSLKPDDPPTRLSRPHEVILHDGRIGQIVEAVTNKRKRHGLCSTSFGGWVKQRPPGNRWRTCIK